MAFFKALSAPPAILFVDLKPKGILSFYFINSSSTAIVISLCITIHVCIMNEEQPMHIN